MNRSLASFVVLAFAFASAAFAATGFVAVPGGKLFYEERGSGPAVILIHGGMLDHRMWDAQAEALALQYRVIRYDVAGCGQSPPIVPEDWSAVDHLRLLMQELKVDRASLVGVSLGGRIAIDFAIAHPAMVRALVLLDPGMSGFPFTARDFRSSLGAQYAARRAGDAQKLAELFLRTWLAGPQRMPAQVDPAVWSRAMEIAGSNALTAGEGAGLDPPAVGRLGEIRAPVLLIEGELDCDDIHRIGALIERRVPGTRRIVIPGVAHMPNLEKPAEVNRLIADFLRRLPPSPPARPSFEAREAMLDVEGGRLWVERAGEGEPVILIHDGIVHAVGWDDVLTRLASQFEVIRYDRRGYGRSTAPEASFSNLADLEAVVRMTGEKKAHLVGSSAGGGLAIDFALAHPDRVASLTLVGAVVSGFPYTRHFFGRGGHITQKAATEAGAARRYWSAEDPYFIAPGSTAVHERVAAILEASPQNLDDAKQKLVVAQPSALPRLGEIRVPALILTGEHDIPDVHAHAGAIAAAIPHARREVIVGTGHVPYMERPEEFAVYVLSFLQSAPFMTILNNDGVEAARAALRTARATNAGVVLFSEDEINRMGARLVVEKKTAAAEALYRLNVEAFPGSASAHAALASLAPSDRTQVEQTVRDAIGWALKKDRARLESIMAHDADFFIFHPDSKSTVRGWDAFLKMIPTFMDPRFKATRFDVRELATVFSASGDVAWYSAMLDDCGEWNGKESCWKDARWTGVLEKRGGTWVIVQMHFSFAKD